MKRTLIKSLLPLMAGAAVIGSGFSIWVFSGTQISETKNLSAKVTKLADVGSFEQVADEFSIVFDQTTTKRGEIGVTSSAEAKGVHLELGTKETTIYKPVTDTDATDNDLASGGKIYHQMTVTLTLGADLGEYVDFNYAGSTKTETTGTYTFVLSQNVDTFDWNTATLAYKTNKEPKDKTEYLALKGKVTAATCTVEYKVEVLSL